MTFQLLSFSKILLYCLISMEMFNIFPHYFIQTIKVWMIRKINGTWTTLPAQLLVHNSSSRVLFSTLLNCSLTILSGWPLLQIQNLQSFRWLVKDVSSEHNLLIWSSYRVHVLWVTRVIVKILVGICRFTVEICNKLVVIQFHYNSKKNYFFPRAFQCKFTFRVEAIKRSRNFNPIQKIYHQDISSQPDP